MKIVAISDTHNRHRKLKIPKCDVLIHAGDVSSRGTKDEIEDFAKWFDEQEATHLIWVPGNHELIFERCLPSSMAWFTDHCPAAHVLIDQGVVIDGVKFWGSPITPEFYDWAWNRARYVNDGRYAYIKDHWDKIPSDTNVLITHGPAYEILDEVLTVAGTSRNPKNHAGCWHLLEAIKRIKPDIHVCGHIHCGHGEKHVDGTSFYNVAICDEMYVPSQPITVIEYK